MAIFKINLEDKAAFLNRMEKAGVALDTDQIVDNKLESNFEVTIDEPKQLEAAKTILKQSPKINTTQKMNTSKKKLTKKELEEMIRKELKSALYEQGQEERKVTITLDEIMQAGSAEYEVGKWAMENFPAIADALKSASTDPDQAIADLGGQVISLATVGTVAVGVGLAVAKDQIVSAAKKLKLAVKSLGGGGVKEGEDSLNQLLNNLPQDVLDKMSK
jgi:hypothetical protein